MPRNRKISDFREAEESTSKKMCDKYFCVYKGLNTKPGEAGLCVFCIAEPNHCNAWHFFSVVISKRHLFRHEEPLYTMYYMWKSIFRISTTRVSGFSPFVTTLCEGFKCGHVEKQIESIHCFNDPKSWSFCLVGPCRHNSIRMCVCVCLFLCLINSLLGGLLEEYGQPETLWLMSAFRLH